jgi:hypothetical protein
MRLRLLDIDGSLPVQPELADEVARGQAQLIDLRRLERPLRLWASRAELDRLVDHLAGLAPPPGDGPMVTFYGSGDYHHLAAPLLEAVAEPVTVVHFDNHPDWIRWPKTWNCGGWVSRALDLPQVARVITLGPSGEDLCQPQFKGGNVAALASGRLELFPWRAAPSRAWGRIGDGAGHLRKGDWLHWRCLADVKNWPDFIAGLADSLPTESVWVSIDKDVLRPEDAVTNWDQGMMPLDFLLTAMDRLSRRRRIVGVDVCGEYSPPRFDGLFKRFEAWRDHPPVRPDAALAMEVNDRTNRALVAALRTLLP